MVYSSSMVWAEYKYGSSSYYFIRQLIFLLIGIFAFLFISRLDVNIYQKYRNVLFVLALIFLIVVLIPGIGIVRGGARSWIGLGDISFQPSEFMKIVIIIFIANYLDKNKETINKLSTLIPILLILLVVFILLMAEPDFGTAFIIMVTSLIMILLAGIKKRYTIVGVMLGAFAFLLLIISAPYRLKRIFAFLDPFEEPLGSGFQIIQSLYAITPNGIFGRGLFNSFQKYFFLPEPQTDFIFAIIVEELGFIGGVVVIGLFITLFCSGIRIAIKAKSIFKTYLSIGIIVSIFIQFFINIGVVIGLLPVTGDTQLT